MLRVRILLHTSGLQRECVCMELYGSVIWRMEMSERGFRRCSACRRAVYMDLPKAFTALWMASQDHPHHVNMYEFMFDLVICIHIYTDIYIVDSLCTKQTNTHTHVQLCMMGCVRFRRCTYICTYVRAYIHVRFRRCWIKPFSRIWRIKPSSYPFVSSQHGALCCQD